MVGISVSTVSGLSALNTLSPIFFNRIRTVLLSGGISQEQADGMNRIYGLFLNDDPRFFAYACATVYREAGTPMQPVREIGRGFGKPYGQTYYGRGLVQLTWAYNYRRAGNELNVNLLKYPDRALDWDVAGPVLYRGMTEGWFTGKKLSDYFNKTTNDAINARRIINGTNMASTVASYYTRFLDAYTA